jgi:opacity protein-like surface antigen
MAALAVDGFASPRSSTLRTFKQVGILAGSAIALVLASSAAHAQCALTGTAGRGERLLGYLGASGNSISSALTALNTAFQTQTSAFISSPPGSQPNEFTGGAWLRTVGGRVDANTDSTGTRTRPAPPLGPFPVSCSTQSRNDFVGVQGGVDIGRLNFGTSGWNAHLGITGGYFETEATTPGGGDTRVEVPFIGLYAAVVGGGFFADAQLLGHFYKISIADPSFAAAGSTDATGFSFASSAGYAWPVGNFIVEPSVGIIYSNAKIDPLSLTGAAINRRSVVTLPARLVLQDIESLLGRAGVRVATSFVTGGVALQPFVAASIWHEFAGNTNHTASFTAPNGVDAVMNLSSSRIGTFGQYSLGFAASVLNTGWLGYARVDYRSGENIEGLGVNAGLRYQFAPAPRTVAAAPPAGAVAAAPHSWTGFYIGAYAGGSWADSATATEVTPPPTAPYGALGARARYDLGSSVIAGLTVGYNHQMGSIVAGLEAEGGYLRHAGSASFVGFPETISSTKAGDWYTLLAARFGFAAGPALLYGKVGGVLLSITSKVTDSTIAGGEDSVFVSGGNSLVTWAAGGGIEFALNSSWSVKGEYLYLATDESYLVTGPGNQVRVGPADIFSWRHDVPGIHTAKIGVNYKFGSEPVVVRASN